MRTLIQLLNFLIVTDDDNDGDGDMAIVVTLVVNLLSLSNEASSCIGTGCNLFVHKTHFRMQHVRNLIIVSSSHLCGK